jgi:upstream activation factor subunit UAF30
MASNKKNSKKVEVEKVEVEKVEVEPVKVEPVKVESSKKTKKTKSEIMPPVVVEVVSSVTEVENITVSTETSSVNDHFNDFLTKFQTLLTQFNQLKVELKTLEKKTTRELKVMQKNNGKKKKKTPRAPSGFIKPAPISDELAIFLGRPSGTEMARTEVTREINKYIREKQLQNKTNGRIIIPDQPLSGLLKITSDIELTYFNLQKYMGPHFPKVVKVEH